MIGFSEIEKIFIPLSCINEAYSHLRECGLKGFEGVALFAGTKEDNFFDIKTTIIPAQKLYKIESGLLYSVDGDELYKMNMWLYTNKQNLIAQIHSHPGRAYHSETDDQFPIVTVMGGISIVVPDFASRAFSIEDWAAYRLVGQQQWEELTIKQIENLIIIK